MVLKRRTENRDGQALSERLRKDLLDFYKDEQVVEDILVARESDIEQTTIDFQRRNVFFIDENGVNTQLILPEDNKQARISTQNFLSKMSGEQTLLSDYFTKYAHQGGFLDSTRVLLKLATEGVPPLENPGTLRLKDNNTTATFKVLEDGSIEYTEAFDITGFQYKKDEEIESFSLPEDHKLATVKATSIISIEEGKVKHSATDISIDTYHPNADNVFKNKKSLFNRLFDCLKRLCTWRAEQYNKNLPKLRNRI